MQYEWWLPPNKWNEDEDLFPEHSFWTPPVPYEEVYGGATDKEIEEYERKEYIKKQNISRDEKGRLMKGSTIAKKRSCDEDDIWYAYNILNWSVKEIVEFRGCSKSTVYNVIKKHKKK